MQAFLIRVESQKKQAENEAIKAWLKRVRVWGSVLRVSSTEYARLIKGTRRTMIGLCKAFKDNSVQLSVPSERKRLLHM